MADRWDDIKLEPPDPDKIVCKDCMHREEDLLDGKIPGSTSGICRMYFHKPDDILWHGADCPYYRNEYNPHRDDDE